MSSPFPFHGIFSSLGQEQALEEHAREQGPFSGGGLPVPDFRHPAGAQGGSTAPSGQVAVDIYEQDGYYIIKAPLAGIRLSDIDIEVSDNVLTIRGTRHQTDTVDATQYYLQECFWGEFSRSVTLPCTIDPKKVKATFNKECILKVLIPKEEKVKIVRISEG